MLELLRVFWEYVVWPSVHYYRKYLLWGTASLLLVLWIGTSWGVFRLPFTSIKAFEAIPENTPLVIETQAFEQTLQQIDKGDYASDLYHISILTKWKRGLRFLDSLFASTETYVERLKQAHIVSGVQLSSRQNAGWLYALEDKDNRFDMNQFVRELMPQRVEKSTYRSYTIYKLTVDEGRTVAFAYYHGVLLASRWTLFVEAGIEQLDNIESNVMRNRAFKQVNHQVDVEEGKMVVYVNFKTLSLLTAVLAKNKNNSSKALAALGAWTGLEARFLEKGFLLSGHFYPDEQNRFLQALAQQAAPKKTKIARYLPKNLAVLLYFGWENGQRLYQQAKESEQPDFEKYILPWLGKEAAIVIKDPIDDKNAFRNDKLVILQTKDTTSSRQLLEAYGQQRGGIQKDYYQNFDITTLKAKHILRPFFGKQLNPIINPHYTIVDNYVVFANSKTALESWVQQYASGQSIEKSTIYKAFVQQNQQQSNMYVLLSTPRCMKFLQYFVREEWRDYLKTHFQHFRNIYPIGIQFHAYANHFLMTLSASHTKVKEQSINQTAIAWAFDLDKEVVGRPQIVKETHGERHFVIVQDSSKRLYCIDKNGQNHWSASMMTDYFINSEVFPIDYYSNEEMQVAFSTSRAIYVVDLDGRVLKKIKLVTPASAGVLKINYGKGPRFFIACRNGGVYGFDKNGRPLTGWQPHQNVGPVDYPLKYLKYKEKDYLIATSRHGACKAFKRNGEAYFRGGELGWSLVHWEMDPTIGRIAGGVVNGQIRVLNMTGRGFSISAPKDMKPPINFVYADVVGDARKDYIRQAGKQFAIHYYKKEKKDKFETYKQDTLAVAQQDAFAVSLVGYEKQFIGTLDDVNKNVSLFDADGRLLNGFPVAGTTRFEVVDLFNEQGNTLVVGNRDRVYAYKLKL